MKQVVIFNSRRKSDAKTGYPIWRVGGSLGRPTFANFTFFLKSGILQPHPRVRCIRDRVLESYSIKYAIAVGAVVFSILKK